MTALRFLLLLALVIWIGGILFFGAVAAPILFMTLPIPMAGETVSRMLPVLHWAGVICGVLFLLLSAIEAHLAGARAVLRNVFVGGMMAVTLISQLVVTPRMEVLRHLADFESLAVSDPRRLAFDRLHQWSTSLEGVVLLLGLAALWMVARGWSIPISASASEKSPASRSSSASLS